MRIIGGRFKGLRLSPPKNLPVRPTTDMAREALFNILENQLHLGPDIKALDLFSGTGGISLELASRGVSAIEAVDRHGACVKFLQDSAKNLGIEGLRTVKADVFAYLDRCVPGSFDFIFADPPYDLDRLTQLPAMVFEKGLLKPGGLFVLEFPSTRKLPAEPVCAQVRKYGNSSFAIYLADA